DVFSGAFEDLSLQTVLYVRGVEDHFGDQVAQLEYLYFRGEDAGDTTLFVDATRVSNGDNGDGLSRDDIDRVGREITARIFEVCRSGELTRFPTAHDESTCRFCAFTAICPGPGVHA
ncbi:MAG: PD-(D/E)XK nuclease family protein, partial [Candidatus Eremiobacteraeota bacterium]|nr:PD-(D/E)XK nuclease family protein [Candidatus Eremiobacteraeota bacterium]